MQNSVNCIPETQLTQARVIRPLNNTVWAVQSIKGLATQDKANSSDV